MVFALPDLPAAPPSSNQAAADPVDERRDDNFVQNNKFNIYLEAETQPPRVTSQVKYVYSANGLNGLGYIVLGGGREFASGHDHVDRRHPPGSGGRRRAKRALREWRHELCVGSVASASEWRQ